MIGPGVAGASFVAYATGYDAGLVGVLTVTIEDSDGNVELAPTTAGIIEIDAGGGASTYRFSGSYPAAVGDYVLIWEDAEAVQAAEELVVSETAPDPSSGPQLGPCESWISGEEVADCCSAAPGSDTSVYDLAAVQASMLLFEVTGRQFSGLCERTVRPTSETCSCWPDFRDFTWYGSWWGTAAGARCGCGALSRIKLAGYPVREILEVTIDGATISAAEYRLDQWRYLTRLADADGNRQHWPACQRLDRAASEEGTFSIRYRHGVSPPAPALAAATQLACELYKACTPGSGDCQLPSGVTKIVRQGITAERVSPLASLLRQGASGLPLVDALIGAYNPGKLRRRPAVMSPDVRFPRREGV